MTDSYFKNGGESILNEGGFLKRFAKADALGKSNYFVPDLPRSNTHQNFFTKKDILDVNSRLNHTLYSGKRFGTIVPVLSTHFDKDKPPMKYVALYVSTGDSKLAPWLPVHPCADFQPEVICDCYGHVCGGDIVIPPPHVCPPVVCPPIECPNCGGDDDAFLDNIKNHSFLIRNDQSAYTDDWAFTTSIEQRTGSVYLNQTGKFELSVDASLADGLGDAFYVRFRLTNLGDNGAEILIDTIEQELTQNRHWLGRAGRADSASFQIPLTSSFRLNFNGWLSNSEISEVEILTKEECVQQGFVDDKNQVFTGVMAYKEVSKPFVAGYGHYEMEKYDVVEFTRQGGAYLGNKAFGTNQIRDNGAYYVIEPAATNMIKDTEWQTRTAGTRMELSRGHARFWQEKKSPPAGAFYLGSPNWDLFSLQEGEWYTLSFVFEIISGQEADFEVAVKLDGGDSIYESLTKIDAHYLKTKGHGRKVVVKKSFLANKGHTIKDTLFTAMTRGNSEVCWELYDIQLELGKKATTYIPWENFNGVPDFVPTVRNDETATLIEK